MKRWKDLRRQRLSSEQLQEVERQVETDLVDMDLRAIRELLGKTQEELAELTQMSQSEISRFERRADLGDPAGLGAFHPIDQRHELRWRFTQGEDQIA